MEMAIGRCQYWMEIHSKVTAAINAKTLMAY